MKKVVIIGAPGSGKSTLARILHDITNLPLIHLDLLFWKPGWVETPKAAWIAMQKELVQTEEWIIDGHYQSTIDIRLDATDVIIFLDMPRRLYMWGVIKRHFLYWGKPRPDLAKGCAEKITWHYLSEVWHFPDADRKIIVEKLLNLIDKKQIIWLTSREETTKFIENLRTTI